MFFPWITAVIENFELPTLSPCFLDSSPKVLILASRFLFFRLVLTAAALSVEGKTGLVFCWVVRFSHRIRFKQHFFSKNWRLPPHCVLMGPRESAIKLHPPGVVCAFLPKLPLRHSLQIHWQIRVECAGWLVHAKVATSSGYIEKACVLVGLFIRHVTSVQVDHPVKPASGNGTRSEFYCIGLSHSLVKSILASLISKKSWSRFFFFNFFYFEIISDLQKVVNSTKNPYLLLPRVIKC